MSQTAVNQAWVGLAIRCVGLFGLLNVLPTCVSSASQLLAYGVYSAGGGAGAVVVDRAFFVSSALATAAYLIVVCVCVYFIVKPFALATRWIRGAFTRCPSCFFDVTGLRGDTCPECGGKVLTPGSLESATAPGGSGPAAD